MTKMKRTIAIASAILLLSTIIYQVAAYDGIDGETGEPVVAVDGDVSEPTVNEEVGEPTDAVDGEGVEVDEGLVCLPEEAEGYLPEDGVDSVGITSLPGDVDLGEDETGLIQDDESEDEEGYMGIEPLITIPSFPALLFIDTTTGRPKYTQVYVAEIGTSPNELSISIAPDVVGVYGPRCPETGQHSNSITLGEIVPENWEIVNWQINYHIIGMEEAIRPIYYTLIDGHILQHFLPDSICLDTDSWLMLPTFVVNLRPIPATLSGTVTCVTCPEREEGVPGLPMPGVTIRLYDGEGDFVRSVVTNEDGFFDFGVVPFGDFELVKVHETVPEGHLSIEPRRIELTIATPAGAYEEHFFVECKEPPTLTKSIRYINGDVYEGQKVVEGDIITYRLRVHNPNPRPWSNFLVVDVLPDGLSLVGDVQVTPESALVEDNSTQAGVNVVIDLPAGPRNVDILFTARVDDVTLAVEGYFVNVATLYGPPENGGERPPIDDCDAEVPVEPPGISLVKVVSEPIAEPGDTLTYTLVVRNTGGAVLTNVVVTDDLPVQLTNPRNLVITPEDAGEGSFEGQLLTVIIPILGLEESVTITFDVTVADDVENGTVIDNVSEVTTDQNVYDEDDERVIVEYEPPQLTTPGISLVKSVSSETVEAGGTLTYTIVVRNTGDEVLTNVVVTDNLPVQLTNPRNLVIAPPGAGTGSFVGQLLTVHIPVLGIDETVIIVFDVTVAGDVADDTVIRNVATVTTDQGPYDEDDAVTTVTEQPPTRQPPGQAPRTGDVGVLETTLFMFIAGATALVMFSLLKTEKRKTRRK